MHCGMGLVAASQEPENAQARTRHREKDFNSLAVANSSQLILNHRNDFDQTTCPEED